MDTSERLKSVSEVNAVGLQGLINVANAAEQLRDEVSPKIKTIIETIDTSMKNLLRHDADKGNLRSWQNRMAQCRDRIETLDLTLMLIGSPKWNWPRAITALGWLHAFIELSKATLRHNGVWIEGMPEKDA